MSRLDSFIRRLEAQRACLNNAAQLIAGVPGNVLEFGLGGDSIMSIQVVSRARQAGLRLTSRDIFLYQTIAELAAVTAVGDGVVGVRRVARPRGSLRRQATPPRALGLAPGRRPR